MTEVSHSSNIYKVFRLTEWADIKTQGVFTGSPDDLRDGFIHFSTAAQLQATLDKYYTDGADVVLGEVKTQSLAPDVLKWEVSRGGAAFPHLYAPLSFADITRYWTLNPDSTGRYNAAAVIG